MSGMFSGKVDKKGQTIATLLLHLLDPNTLQGVIYKVNKLTGMPNSEMQSITSAKNTIFVTVIMLSCVRC